jgi:hypothetical protein
LSNGISERTSLGRLLRCLYLFGADKVRREDPASGF